MKTERLRAGDIELEAVTGGRGPTALLLHGPTTYTPETPFLDLLGQTFSVTAPSHPGFGESTRPDHIASVYDLVRCYLDLLDGLPLDKPVTLIGASFGGWLAAEIAVTYGHRLAQLVLIGPVGIKVGSREDRDITHLFNTHPAEVERRAWHDPAKQRSGVLGLGWQQHLDAMTDDEMVRMARGWDALCQYAWSPHLYNPSLARWLRRITVPTLVLQGASDQIVAPGYLEAYAGLIPGAQIQTIPAAGHHPELEQPEAVVEQIRRVVGASSA